MTKHQIQRRCTVLAGVVAVSLLVAHAPTTLLEAQQQPTDIAVVISGDPGTPPRYAVPDFVALTPDAAEAAKTIGQVLWDDLNFEKEFYMIPRDTYGTIPASRSAEDVQFAAWRELGADAVFVGTVRRAGDDVSVEVRLFNVRTRQSVFGKVYGGKAANSNPRLYAHTIADEIHQQQRNLRGVARTKLAFVSDRNRERLDGTVETRDTKEIYIADYDGANQRRLTVSRQLNLNPSWSPDATSLAYTTYRQNRPDIYVSRIYEGVMQNPTKGIGTNYLPAFSPDGKQIAFMSGRDGNPEIYVMNVDGTNLRRLTNHPAEDVTPTWSPTGTQIAFESGRTGKSQIYIMNAADGSNLQRLNISESEATRPTWSRGPVNEIAYAARTSGAGFDIKVYDFNSGQTKQLTFGEGTNESPAFSPNGRHIAFTSTRGGRVQIYTIGRDGRDLRQITRDGSNQTPAWSN